MNAQLNILARRLRLQFVPESRKTPDHEVDEHLATALLLAELARADDDVEESEKAVIEKLLAQHFELDEAETRALMAKAAAQEKKTISLYNYVQSLNERLDYPGRCKMIEMLWQVAWADGHLDASEEHRLRKIAGLLYVSDTDFIRVKIKVMEAAGVSAD